MTSNFPYARAVIGILGSALLAVSFVAAAAGPAYAAPIAASRIV
jgi:hypothetical protein|nr:hypothetical protein [Polymorphobacter sp.]